MASAIDATKPVFGSPTTASVRANFAAAKSEIEALQVATFALTVSTAIAGDPDPITLPGTIGATVSVPLFDYSPATSFIIVRVLAQTNDPEVNYNVELFDDARLVYQATGITGDEDYNDYSLFFVDNLEGTNLTVTFTSNTEIESAMFIGVKYLAATGGETPF